jgi:acyl-CoA thioesterase-1
VSRGLTLLRYLLLLGFALSVQTAHAGGSTPKVLVLGDSISAAYGMSLEQGWVSLLEERLQSRWSGAEIVKASISGDTSAGGLRRLAPLLEQHRPDLLVIELGGNDGLRGYPNSRLLDNLREMARRGISAGSRVLILPMEIPPNYGQRYTNAFRQAFRDAAADTGAVLGPFIMAEIATDPALMQSDGIHPVVAAQPLMVDTLESVVSDMLGDAIGQTEHVQPQGTLP